MCGGIEQPNAVWPVKPSDPFLAAPGAWLEYIVDTLDEVKKFTHGHAPLLPHHDHDEAGNNSGEEHHHHHHHTHPFALGDVSTSEVALT